MMHTFCKEYPYEQNIYQVDTKECQLLQGQMLTNEEQILKLWLASYETQHHPCFCGLASLSIIQKFFKLQSCSTQLLTYETQVKGKIWRTKDDINRGFTLAKLAALFKTVLPDFIVTCLPCCSAKLAYDTIKEHMFDKNTAIVINYCRNINGHHGGHFSPVIATAPDKSEKVFAFIEDVSLRANPHWIELESLSKLISTYDRGAESYRGVICIARK